MSDTARLPPVLLGLFRELLANGVPLGVRDPALALWFRSETERRLITRWCDLVPIPAPALVDAIAEALANVPASSADQAVGERQAGTAPAGENLSRKHRSGWVAAAECLGLVRDAR